MTTPATTTLEHRVYALGDEAWRLFGVATSREPVGHRPRVAAFLRLLEIALSPPSAEGESTELFLFGLWVENNYATSMAYRVSKMIRRFRSRRLADDEEGKKNERQ